MESEIVFFVNEHEKICLFLACELKDMTMSHYVEAIYITNNGSRYVLYPSSVFINFVEVLDNALMRALTRQIILDESLVNNIGYAWSVYLYNLSKSRPSQITSNWAGYKCLLWDFNDVAVWLYEKNGKFYFEVTPFYNWHHKYVERKERKEYITHKQFIENYKSYFAVELSLETIYTWRKQLQHLTAIMDFNEEKHSNGRF